MPLELVVRPYQRPPTAPTRRLLSTRAVVEVDEARVTWGKAGQLPEAVEVPPGDLPPLIAFEVKKRKEQLETARVTEEVRIENPDDPDQYVIVERTKAIRFTEKDPETVKSYPPSRNSVAYAGTTAVEDWQPGEQQVNTDGSGPPQTGETRTYYDDSVPLKVEDRDYLFKDDQGNYTSILTGS